MSFEVSLYAEDRVEYVPDFMHNRACADSWAEDGEQGDRLFCTVDLLPMSSRDLNKLTIRAFRGYRGNSDDAIGRSEAVHARIFAKYVPAVRGLRLRGRDGETHEPQNGGELFALSVGAASYLRDNLIEDIIGALKDLSRADEGDLGKLRLRHASTKPAVEEK